MNNGAKIALIRVVESFPFGFVVPWLVLCFLFLILSGGF